MLTLSNYFIQIIILLSNLYVLLAQNNSQSIIEIKDGSKVLAKDYIRIESANIKNVPERASGFKQVGKLCYGITVEAMYTECMIQFRNYNKYWVT